PRRERDLCAAWIPPHPTRSRYAFIHTRSVTISWSADHGWSAPALPRWRAPALVALRNVRFSRRCRGAGHGDRRMADAAGRGERRLRNASLRPPRRLHRMAAGRGGGLGLG